MRNDKAFHEPIQPEDSEKQTFWCRHTNPDICARNRIPEKCAFTRNDNLCLSPPKSWPKQFHHLKLQTDENIKVNING